MVIKNQDFIKNGVKMLLVFSITVILAEDEINGKNEIHSKQQRGLFSSLPSVPSAIRGILGSAMGKTPTIPNENFVNINGNIKSDSKLDSENSNDNGNTVKGVNPVLNKNSGEGIDTDINIDKLVSPEHHHGGSYKHLVGVDANIQVDSKLGSHNSGLGQKISSTVEVDNSALEKKSLKSGVHGGNIAKTRHHGSVGNNINNGGHEIIHHTLDAGRDGLKTLKEVGRNDEFDANLQFNQNSQFDLHNHDGHHGHDHIISKPLIGHHAKHIRNKENRIEHSVDSGLRKKHRSGLLLNALKHKIENLKRKYSKDNYHWNNVWQSNYYSYIFTNVDIKFQELLALEEKNNNENLDLDSVYSHKIDEINHDLDLLSHADNEKNNNQGFLNIDKNSGTVDDFIHQKSSFTQQSTKENDGHYDHLDVDNYTGIKEGLDQYKEEIPNDDSHNQNSSNKSSSDSTSSQSESDVINNSAVLDDINGQHSSAENTVTKFAENSDHNNQKSTDFPSMNDENNQHTGNELNKNSDSLWSSNDKLSTNKNSESKNVEDTLDASGQKSFDDGKNNHQDPIIKSSHYEIKTDESDGFDSQNHEEGPNIHSNDNDYSTSSSESKSEGHENLKSRDPNESAYKDKINHKGSKEKLSEYEKKSEQYSISNDKKYVNHPGVKTGGGGYNSWSSNNEPKSVKNSEGGGFGNRIDDMSRNSNRGEYLANDESGKRSSSGSSSTSHESWSSNSDTNQNQGSINQIGGAGNWNRDNMYESNLGDPGTQLEIDSENVGFSKNSENDDHQKHLDQSNSGSYSSWSTNGRSNGLENTKAGGFRNQIDDLGKNSGLEKYSANDEGNNLLNDKSSSSTYQSWSSSNGTNQNQVLENQISGDGNSNGANEHKSILNNQNSEIELAGKKLGLDETSNNDYHQKNLGSKSSNHNYNSWPLNGRYNGQGNLKSGSFKNQVDDIVKNSGLEKYLAGNEGGSDSGSSSTSHESWSLNSSTNQNQGSKNQIGGAGNWNRDNVHKSNLGNENVQVELTGEKLRSDGNSDGDKHQDHLSKSSHGSYSSWSSENGSNKPIENSPYGPGLYTLSSFKSSTGGADEEKLLQDEPLKRQPCEIHHSNDLKWVKHNFVDPAMEHLEKIVESFRENGIEQLNVDQLALLDSFSKEILYYLLTIKVNLDPSTKRQCICIENKSTYQNKQQ